MGVRKFNPITPGQRFRVLSKFEEITTDKPHKPLTGAHQEVWWAEQPTVR